MRNIIVLSLLLLQSCFGYGQKFEGTWQGELKVQGVALPLVFYLEYASAWNGTMESPAQGNAKLPLSTIHIEQDSISISVASIGLTYNGKLLSDGEIEGVVSQNGMTFPMRLSKTDNTLAKRRRPQLPEPPYSYDTVDVTFHSEYDDVKLAGTITMPREGEKFPAVVLVSG